MMVKQPDNTYDPNAVAVQTLHGQDLGYVPREHTARFPHDVTFGHVYSLGQNAKGLWSTANTWLLRLAVMTSSILPYLAGYSLHTADLTTSTPAMMTCKNCWISAMNRLSVSCWMGNHSLA